MIELEQVTKTFGRKVAVDNLSLHIERGELFAFLGPNGAGKTTTIKLMCGLLFPTAGTIHIAGFNLKDQGEQARKLISYVPDQPFLYEKLTGREILHFIADMYGMERGHARNRIEDMIAIFSLGDFVDDLTEQYSHGMRQRTVFASALLHEPEVSAQRPLAQGPVAPGSGQGSDSVLVHTFVGHRPGIGGPHRRSWPG